jgi:5-formyltetrahydrofolate cyclo-ligase
VTSTSQNEQRRAGLAARRALDDAERNTASQRVTSRFLRSSYFYSARDIACYFSMWDEVETGAIVARAWQASKRVWCPVVADQRRLRFVAVTRETRLVSSAFGLLEPDAGPVIDPLDLDVVVIPLVAFDTHRHRIGMGGGYYDCTFARLNRCSAWRRPKLVGLAFECQKVRKIKANPWDIELDAVITG